MEIKGELAEQQSIFIMRAFREMRHYIMQNQQFVTSSEMKFPLVTFMPHICQELPLKYTQDFVF
jgi:hypothetical protein